MLHDPSPRYPYDPNPCWCPRCEIGLLLNIFAGFLRDVHAGRMACAEFEHILLTL